MTPAPSAGSESTQVGTKKRRRRKRSSAPHQKNSSAQKPAQHQSSKQQPVRHHYAKRVDETSAGGLVIDVTRTKGLLIGRIDQKDATRQKILWSLPKGHIEEGETPEEAAIREVQEETGITSSITRSLGVIDFWFMASGKRIHKTVHHFLFDEVGGVLAPQESEVDEVAWFPLNEIVDRLAYPDEKKLIARSGDLV